jgi:undecaprenyl-diphosphatase
MVGAFGYSFWKNRDQLDFSQLGAIGVGFVAAFLSALLVVRLFLEVVSRVGFTPFALYRIGLGLLILAAVSAGYFT